MRPLPLLSCLFLLLLLLAACASAPRWVNAAVPKDRWADDYAACRHFSEDRLPPSALFEPGSERTDDPMRMVDRDRAHRGFDAGVELCMRTKGYVPAQ